MASGLPYKIDTHAHFLPPVYRQACIENGHANPDGMPYLPEWSEEEHLKLMDELNITKSILSISSPGTHLVAGDEKLAATLTRECNKHAADLKERLPARFGYFASLPIPCVELCLQEIAHASREGCDGFVMMTNGHGIYPGDKLLDPIFEELNRRQASVFFHPCTPMCPCSGDAAAGSQKPIHATPFAGQYPNPMIEFMFDSARVITNLFLSGTIKRSPKIQFIFPHCGGAFPPILSRVTVYSTIVPVPWTGVSEEEAREAFKRQIWFDLAGVPFPGQIQGLLAAGGIPSQLLYGSDFPFARADPVRMFAQHMDNGVKEIFSDEEIEDIYHRNAERLRSMPKIR